MKCLDSISEFISSSGPQDYKTFCMLNSAEHEILSIRIKTNQFFSGSDKLIMLFFLLIDVKLPTSVEGKN